MKTSVHKKAKAIRQQASFFAKKKERSFFGSAALHTGFINRTSVQEAETADNDFTITVEEEEQLMDEVFEFPSITEDAGEANLQAENTFEPKPPTLETEAELLREPIVHKEQQRQQDIEAKSREMAEPSAPEEVFQAKEVPEPVIAKTNETTALGTEDVKQRAIEPAPKKPIESKIQKPPAKEMPVAEEKEKAEEKEEEQTTKQKAPEEQKAEGKGATVGEVPGGIGKIPVEEAADKAEEPSAEGGAAAPQAVAAMEPVPLDGSDTDSLLKSWTSSPPVAFIHNDSSVNSLAGAAQQKEKQELKESYPVIEKPTGVPAKETPVDTVEGTGLQKEVAPELSPEGGKQPLPKLPPVSISTRPLNNTPLPKDLSKPAAEEDEGSWFERLLGKVQGFLGKIRTTDGSVDTDAGPRPNVPLEGESDPKQNKEHQAEADTSVDADKQKSDTASEQYFGENDVYPESNPEMLTPATDPAAPSALGKAPAGEMPVFDAQTGEAFNLQARAKMDEQVDVEMAKYETERQKKDTDSVMERENTQAEIDQETDKTRTEQEGLQQQAKTDVDGQRAKWKEENELVKQTYADSSEQKRTEIDTQIDAKVAETETQVTEKYNAAEGEAEAAKRKAEEDATRKKREEENKPRSWWQKVKDGISSVLNAIKGAVNAIFDAVRSVVKGIIDAVKSAVLALIDLARNAIVGLIKAFGEALRAFVNIALAAFPELAKKFNDYIDSAVNYAVEKVNQLADALKAAVSALLDALASVLDAILSAYQAICNAIVDVLHFLTVGLMEILEGIANLVSAASDMPDQFWGQVSEEMLGVDVTKPLPNEAPMPGNAGKAAEQLAESGVITDKEKDVVQKGSLDTNDVEVDQMASDFQLEPEVMDEIVTSMPEDGETIIETGEGGPEEVAQLKEQALTGQPDQQETTTTAEEEPMNTNAETQAPAPASEQAGAEQEGGLVGPFSGPGERIAYLAAQMKEAIKKWWSDNKVAIIAALVLGITGVILANIFTGGAILAALPLLLQIAAAAFAIQAITNAAKYFGTFLSEGYSGNIIAGAKALARASAIIVIELASAFIFGAKGALKGAKAAIKTVAKQGVKGALKTGGKAVKTAVTTSVKNTGKAIVKLGGVAKSGGRAVLKNGKLVLKGVKSGFGKGAKSIGALAKKIAAKLKLKRIKIVKQKWRFSIWGEFNPWVLMATGKVKYVEFKVPKTKGPKVKAPKIGDTFAGGIVVGRNQGKGTSAFVKNLIDNPAFNKKITDLLATGGKIDKQEFIKAMAKVPAQYADEILDAVKQFKDIPGIDKVIQDLGKRGGNFTLGATFTLTFFKRNPELAALVVNFEKAVTVLGNLRREVDVVLKGKSGWLEFKNWKTFRPSTFAKQMIKDVSSGKPFKWIFSKGLGSKDEVRNIVRELLENKEFLKKLTKAERQVLERNIDDIVDAIDVADFHITF